MALVSLDKPKDALNVLKKVKKELNIKNKDID